MLLAGSYLSSLSKTGFDVSFTCLQNVRVLTSQSRFGLHPNSKNFTFCLTFYYSYTTQVCSAPPLTNSLPLWAAPDSLTTSELPRQAVGISLTLDSQGHMRFPRPLSPCLVPMVTLSPRPLSELRDQHPLPQALPVSIVVLLRRGKVLGTRWKKSQRVLVCIDFFQ